MGTGGAALRAGAPTQFTIRAVDAWGNRRSSGGEAFFAALASAVFDVPGVEENLTAGADWVADGRLVVAPWLATDEDDGTYTVRYTPSAEGAYIVEATTASRELVGGRPFAVRVVQAQTALENTLFLCAPDTACAFATDNDGGGGGGGGVVTAGRRGALRLQARDAAGNNKTDKLDRFYFSWSGGSGESGGGRARPLGAAAPGAYEVTLNAAVAGPVRLRVVAGAQTLLDTVMMVVPAAMDVPSATWGGDALPAPVVAGYTAEASLTLRDAFGNALGAEAHAAAAVAVSLHCDRCIVEPLETRLAVVTTSADGYVVRLSRTEAGVYVLRATVDGEQAPSAEVTVQAAALDPTATSLSLDSNSTNDGGPLTMVAGRESTLCFTFRDAYGNVRTQGSDLTAATVLTVAPPPFAATGERRDLVAVEPISVAFNTPESNNNNTCGEHTYALRLVVPTAGRAWVSHVAPLSPLLALLADHPALLPAMTVVPAAANASECRVVFPAAAAMGRPTSFVVRAADALGNPMLTAADFTVATQVTGDQAAADSVFLSDVRCVLAQPLISLPPLLNPRHRSAQLPP